MEIKNRRSPSYICTLDPMSAVDMGDILTAIKKTVKSHNENVRYAFRAPYRTEPGVFKRITIKGRKPIDGKRTYFNDIANKYTNARELDIYIHEDYSATRVFQDRLFEEMVS